MQLQALIFDVDGTLADNERDGHRVAFNAAFAGAGLDWQWSPPLYGELLEVAGGKERLKHYLLKVRQEALSDREVDALVARLHEAKTRAYLEILAAGRLPLRPGVERLLAEARSAGLRLAIATTTTQVNVTTLLARALGEDAVDWFEVIGAGDVVPRKKPAPDVYEYVIGELALPASACLAIEDSVQGLESARAAGLPAIVTVNGYTRSQRFDGALLVVSDLGEPDAPFELISGNPFGADYVDVNLLRQLHGATTGND
jgi:HAD superfamily hydrolase (TIGR01509 family)